MRKILLASAAVLFAFAVVFTQLPVSRVGAARVTTDTHLGRPPSEHVTLVRNAAASGGYRRQGANGVYASSDFVIAPNQVLVITDVEVIFRRATEPNQSVQFFLESNDSTAPGIAIRARLFTTLDGDGFGAVSERIQAGIVIASTSSLTDNMPATSFDVATVRGYLVADN